MQALLFRAAGQLYGLDIHEVVEVVPSARVRPVPHAPASVPGLLQYHAQAVPVIDLGQLLKGLPCRDAYSTRIILVRYPTPSGERLLGLRAEQVTEMAALDPKDRQSPGVRFQESTYLGDLVPGKEGLIQLLRVSELLPAELRESLYAAERDRTPAP